MRRWRDELRSDQPHRNGQTVRLVCPSLPPVHPEPCGPERRVSCLRTSWTHGNRPPKATRWSWQSCEPTPAQQTRRIDGAGGGSRFTDVGTFHRVNSEVAAAGHSVRARGRSLVVNSPWMVNAAGNIVASLVGPGIVTTPNHPDETVRADLTAYFERWAEDADADGRTDWWGLQADIVRGLFTDGEAFVQVIVSDDGPKLRLIPPELVDASLTRELGGGAQIVQGVEFDAAGIRVAYWVSPAKPTDQFASYAAPIRIPANEILHVMKPLAAGQVRGISWLAPVILSAGDFDILEDALLMGAKVAALHAGFIENLNGTTGETYEADADGLTGIQPGGLHRLGFGETVKFNSPQQASDLGPFIRLQLQKLAAGLGLPEHLVSGDLTGANYSSLRAGLLPFRQRVEQIQYGTLVPQLLRPIWKHVITFGILSGEIAAPDFESYPRAYLSCSFLPPKPMQVDPAKQVQADVAELDAGLTSRRKLIAERGWSIEEIDAERAADTTAPEKEIETPPDSQSGKGE